MLVDLAAAEFFVFVLKLDSYLVSYDVRWSITYPRWGCSSYWGAVRVVVSVWCGAHSDGLWLRIPTTFSRLSNTFFGFIQLEQLSPRIHTHSPFVGPFFDVHRSLGSRRDATWSMSRSGPRRAACTMEWPWATTRHFHMRRMIGPLMTGWHPCNVCHAFHHGLVTTPQTPHGLAMRNLSGDRANLRCSRNDSRLRQRRRSQQHGLYPPRCRCQSWSSLLEADRPAP